MVIATVFLAIIGMSAGLALGTRHERAQQSADQPTEPVVPVAPSATSGSGPSAIRCPDEMEQTARAKGYSTPLEQVMRVRAADTGTTVWICSDAKGGLYYQSNKGGYEATWIEGETALFLPKVKKKGDTYVGIAPDGNVFTVSPTELRIAFASGREDEVHSVDEE